jgi:uncharacterized protein with HEPN domain/predicted nucleotidyltransferase
MQSQLQTNLSEFLQQRLKVSADEIASFCDRWKIAEFALFGSVLRDDFRSDSDIDVLVTFSPESQWNFFEIVHAQQELETLLGRKVDLTQKKGLVNPFSRAAILKAYRAIYPPEKANFIEIEKADKMTQDNVRNSSALLDIVQAINRIQRFTANLGFEDYIENELVRNAVERNCEIIGEAVRRITPEFREAHPEVDWSGAVGLRNIMIHQYDRVDNETIWRIVTAIFPVLLPQIERLLPPLPDTD